MITKGKQDVIDAFSYTCDINRVMFDLKVCLEEDMNTNENIQDIILDIQRNNLQNLNNLNKLRTLLRYDR